MVSKEKIRLVKYKKIGMKKRVKILFTGIIVAFTFTATAQWDGPKYGEDSVACITNISLYRESFRQENYAEAYKYWQWTIQNCPMSSKNNFTNGPVILEHLIKTEKDSTKKEVYIKELFDLYELRIQCYPSDEAYALGQNAVNTMRFRAYEWEKAYEIFNKAIDLGGKNTSPQVLDVFFITAERYMLNKQLTSEVMIDAYDKITEILDYKLDESEIEFDKSMRKIYDLQSQLDSGLISKDEYDVKYEDLAKDSVRTERVFEQYQRVGKNMDIRFSQYANCEDLVQIYGKKLEQSKEERVLRQIIKFFNKEGCTNNDIYVTAVEEIHKIQPNANTAFYMGLISYKNAKYQDAISYFKEALTMFEKVSDKIKTYLMLSESYNKVGQYSVARETAYSILKLNPNEARAYIVIGDLYASSGSTCGSLELPGAVYWAAADKYSKAMAMTAGKKDENQAKTYNDAQSKLNSVAKAFPKIETYFQIGLQKGKSYRVECWIGETTTVR